MTRGVAVVHGVATVPRSSLFFCVQCTDLTCVRMRNRSLVVLV